MLKKLKFSLGDDRYTINILKQTLFIKNDVKFTREFYQLDSIEIGEDWIVLETSLSKTDEMIWDFENIDIDFIYKKGR